jgi:uncharacterized protein (TIGR00159 family)
MLPFFIHIRVVDVIDILLVAILIYQVYQLVKGTVAINIFFGIIIFYCIYLLVDALQMKLLSQILGQFTSVGVIVLVVVFQQEIRRFLLLLGNTWLHNRLRIFRRIIPTRIVAASRYGVNTYELKNAVKDLVQNQTGALIVILKNSELKQYIRTGVPVDALLTSQLVHNIFFKNSPLHDGAIFIKGSTIKAARCILPISEKADFPENLGLRHRAAVGITEVSDAIAIIVSEQTQQVSLAYHGKLELTLTIDQLIEKVEKYLSEP